MGKLLNRIRTYRLLRKHATREDLGKMIDRLVEEGVIDPDLLENPSWFRILTAKPPNKRSKLPTRE